MYFVASKEMEDIIVRELRRFFVDVGAYGWIVNKDFSILGEPYATDENSQPYFLISVGFPDRFRFYPHIMIKCSVQRFFRLEADNLVVQEDEINEFGKRVFKDYIRGGHIAINLSATVRSLDQAEAEEISDLLAYWSAYDGWFNLKKIQAFIEPFSYPQGVITENIKDSTDQQKIYKINLGTSIRLSWLKREEPEALTLTKVTVQQTDSELI